MRQHTSDFKNKIKQMGREIKSVAMHGSTELELFDVRYSFEGNILKSVMRCLEIECTDELQKDDVITYKLGLKVGNAYEYMEFGSFIVKEVEKMEDADHYKVTCYDALLKSMKNYVAVNVQYPVTIREYITALCDELGITFANETDEFANYDRQLSIDPYDGLDYTYRDIFDELAQVTASAICINADDELEIRYITNTSDTIDESFLKDVNVDFGEKYGPINSIVLSRSAESDNVFIQDGQSVAQNGLHEIKIKDNQIMNFNDRSDYLPDLLEKLDGLNYYVNDFSSIGITYYDLLDAYNVSIKSNTYNCLMLNDEINISLGLEEIIHTDMPEQSETDYDKADKTDRRINQTYLIVDKQNQKIESMAQQIGDRSEKTTSITQDIDHIELQITDIEDLTLEVTGANPITLENCLEGPLLQFKIKGNNFIFSGLYPATVWQPPTNSLTPRGDSILVVKHYEKDENDQEVEIIERFDLHITEPLRQYSSTVYDEFIYDYEAEDYKAKVVRRVGVLPGNNLYELAEPVIEPVEIDDIILTKGKNIIDIASNYTAASCYARYVQINDFTKQFATVYEVQSSITQLANSITLLVSEKVDKNEVIAQINVAVQEGQGIIRIEGNQVIIDSDFFHLSADGEIIARKGSIGYWTLEGRDLHSIVQDENIDVQAGMYATSQANKPFFYCGKDPYEEDFETANFYVTHEGVMKINNINMNGESGYAKINFDSGRTAVQLGSYGIDVRIDDSANGLFGSINRGSTDFTIEGLSCLAILFYDRLHARNMYRMELLNADGLTRHWISGKMFCDKYMNGSWTEVALTSDLSDERVKENIEDCEKSGLEVIDAIQFKQFDWDNTTPNAGTHVDIGVIAQNLQQLDKNYVDDTIRIYDGEEQHLLSVNTLNLLTTTAKAVQELSQKVKDLEEEIRKLKGEE